MMKTNRIYYRTIIVAVLTALSFTVTAQKTTSSKESYAQKLPGLSDKERNDYADKLAKIAEWSDIKAQYQDSLKKEQDLRQQVSPYENQYNDLNKRQENIQKQLSSMLVSNRKERTFEQMFALYDTLTLLRQKGLYGNEKMEKTTDALLACHRAEQVLTCRYDKNKVFQAHKMLLDAQNLIPSNFIKQLDSRVMQYAEKTQKLKQALTEVNDLRPEVNPNRSDIVKKEKVKVFFSELEKRLDPELVANASDYPYLDSVLQEAIRAKMKDPSNDITDIINKL